VGARCKVQVTNINGQLLMRWMKPNSCTGHHSPGFWYTTVDGEGGRLRLNNWMSRAEIPQLSVVFTTKAAVDLRWQ